MMNKGCTRLFLTIVITVLMISFAIFFVQWVFRIGNAQYAQLSEISICRETGQTPGLAFEKVDPIITDTINALYICGFLETDGRPAELLTTVRNSKEELVYYKYCVYEPGNVHIPFTIPVGNEDDFDIHIYKGRTILGKVMIKLNNP